MPLTQDSILVRRVLNFSQTTAEKCSHYMEVFHGFYFLTVLAGAIWFYVSFATVFVQTVLLKGHGNKPNFPRFLHKSLWPRSLTLYFEPFRFWFRIRGDIRIRKTTPRIGESGSRQDCLEYPFFSNL